MPLQKKTIREQTYMLMKSITALPQRDVIIIWNDFFFFHSISMKRNNKWRYLVQRISQGAERKGRKKDVWKAMTLPVFFFLPIVCWRCHHGPS